MSEKRVVWTNPDGSVSVLIPAPGVDEAVWRKDIPEGVAPIITTADKLPPDRMFRKAWQAADDGCVECPSKAKALAHEIRRAKRAEEFAPHDDVVAKRLPGEQDAEVQRQLIRQKYAVVQTQIDACQSTAELRNVLSAV